LTVETVENVASETAYIYTNYEEEELEKIAKRALNRRRSSHLSAKSVGKPSKREAVKVWECGGL